MSLFLRIFLITISIITFTFYGGMRSSPESASSYGTTRIKTDSYQSPLHMSFTRPSIEQLHHNINLFHTMTISIKHLLDIPDASANPDCFRSGGIPLVAGPNLWAPCCNCTVNGYPVGCLNLMCSTWPAAIYDELTGVCGCG